MIKGIEQDHEDDAAFGLAVEVWTLWHATRYLDAHPRASYGQVMNWLHERLPCYYPWALVTATVEQYVVERLARRPATQWV